MHDSEIPLLPKDWQGCVSLNPALIPGLVLHWDVLLGCVLLLDSDGDRAGGLHDIK